MKLDMMAIYDQASRAFLPPFFVASEALAMRELRDLSLKNPDHNFVRHADQYTLFLLGDFDNETGLTTVKSSPSSLGTLQVIFNLRELPLQMKE